MILVLKNKATNQQEEVAWSEEAVNFLLRYGAIPESGTDSAIKNVFIVDDPCAVRAALHQAFLI